MKSFREYIKEDGMMGGGDPGPTNIVSSGAIAGTGGRGGEPGVDNDDDAAKKRKKKSPIMMGMAKRK
jgi:hypothetical protein